MGLFSFIGDIFGNLLGSLNTKDGGYSGRKLSALAAIIVSIHSTERIVDAGVLMYVIFGWLVFASICLGLVTIPELIKFLNSKNETNGSDIQQ